MEKAILRTLCLSVLLLSTSAFSQDGDSINGRVIYHNDDSRPLSGVTALLHDSTGNMIDSETTDNYGNYTFSNVAPGNYNVTFTTGQDAGGVSLVDPFIILERLSGQITFDAIQELAADVDGDGTVTQEDYDLILIAYMNEENPFPIGPWVFEPLPVTIPAAAREGFTSRGGSSGDVNGSLVPDPKTNSIFLTNPVISLTAKSSDPIEFKLSSAGNLNVAGMHLVLKIPEGLSVLNVESSIDSASIKITNNEVRVSWINESMQAIEIENGVPLLVITTKETNASRDENTYCLKLSDESHFINAEGEEISGINLILPTINFSAVEDIVVTAYPNPFKEYTNLNYQLTGEGNVIISLFDQAGKQVQKIVNSDASAGSNQVKIDGAGLMPGIYHYCISYTGSDQFINTGTIIKSK